MSLPLRHLLTLLPITLGAAISHGIYNEFKDEPGTEPVAYGTFLLFIGIAMSITAFPVLCRILTELQLLSTPVGIITLASGVGDDVVGWVLLALCVDLVNAGSGITALYIILCAIGWGLFLTFGVRPGFMWVLRRTNSIQDGPTQGVMVLAILMVRTSLVGRLQYLTDTPLAVPWISIFHWRDRRASHLRSLLSWSDHAPRRRLRHQSYGKDRRPNDDAVLAALFYALRLEHQPRAFE